MQGTGAGAAVQPCWGRAGLPGDWRDLCRGSGSLAARSSGHASTLGQLHTLHPLSPPGTSRGDAPCSSIRAAEGLPPASPQGQDPLPSG